jgi:hypothetical protein
MTELESVQENDTITVQFKTSVDDKRTETVVVESTDPKMGVLYVSTTRTDGPHFYIYENGDISLYSVKSDTLIPNFGANCVVKN